MSFASFSDSFKYFHTVDTFAALVCATIWPCHVVIQKKRLHGCLKQDCIFFTINGAALM